MIRIGTSGWMYDDWRGSFYPEGLKRARWLDFYGRHFDTVEVNATFYRLPSRESFEDWARLTPPGFLFAVKASRFITHVKRLREPEEPIRRLFAAAEGLGEKLGPVLFQLPPRFPADPERLAYFLSALPSGQRAAFEFRDPSWLSEPIYALLRRHDAAFCIADAPEFPRAEEITASYLYLRLHGRTQLYASEYSEEELRDYAAKLRAWTAPGRDAYVYFDNDVAARAVRNADTLRDLLSPPR